VDRLLPNAIQLHKGNDELQLVGGVRRYFFFHQLLGFLLAFFIIARDNGFSKVASWINALFLLSSETVKKVNIEAFR
jgi:hypothetical protein